MGIEHRDSRSRSPIHSGRHTRHQRTRSPFPTVHHGHKPGHRSLKAAVLPFEAQHISKHDLSKYRAMFALYLDIQKQMDIEELSDDEIKGRWKSFVGKWNRGELAEGWYDPNTLIKSMNTDQTAGPSSFPNDQDASHDLSDSDATYGPTLPPEKQSDLIKGHSTSLRLGPAIPSTRDLQLKHEQEQEDADEARHQHRKSLYQERNADRKLQKEHLEELVPKAEAGTRERQMEKKREKADSNRTFAASKDAGGEVELRDADVMGDEDSLGQLKQMKKEQERKKNDREIRREEALRARIAEREERMAGMREKEKKTMDMLKEIARARFGHDDGTL